MRIRLSPIIAGKFLTKTHISKKTLIDFLSISKKNCDRLLEDHKEVNDVEEEI